MSLEANAAELTRLILRDLALACARAMDDARIRAIGVCALVARATMYNTFKTMFNEWLPKLNG